MLSFFLRRHPVPTALLAVALAGLLWFATGFVREALYFSDPAHQQGTRMGEAHGRGSNGADNGHQKGTSVHSDYS